jgi:hypothetical protein
MLVLILQKGERREGCGNEVVEEELNQGYLSKLSCFRNNRS